MKQETISISIDAEKLRATKKYMEKKELSIEKELADALQKLYEKHVPATVRDYIDETADDDNLQKILKNSREAKRRLALCRPLFAPVCRFSGRGGIRARRGTWRPRCGAVRRVSRVAWEVTKPFDLCTG